MNNKRYSKWNEINRSQIKFEKKRMKNYSFIRISWKLYHFSGVNVYKSLKAIWFESINQSQIYSLWFLLLQHLHETKKTNWFRNIFTDCFWFDFHSNDTFLNSTKILEKSPKNISKVNFNKALQKKNRRKETIKLYQFSLNYFVLPNSH